MTDRERILKEIEDKKRELQLLEEKERIAFRDDAICSLEDFTIEDKVKAFDTLYNSILNSISIMEEKGYYDDDEEHYLWEETITMIITKNPNKFWKYFNSIR
jgi:hypothetical protein